MFEPVFEVGDEFEFEFEGDVALVDHEFVATDGPPQRFELDDVPTTRRSLPGGLFAVDALLVGELLLTVAFIEVLLLTVVLLFRCEVLFSAVLDVLDGEAAVLTPPLGLLEDDATPVAAVEAVEIEAAEAVAAAAAAATLEALVAAGGDTCCEPEAAAAAAEAAHICCNVTLAGEFASQASTFT